MLDKGFFENFMETDPNKATGSGAPTDKEMYTRAEVDEIVQNTIKSTMEAINNSMMQSNPEEPEESEDENGSSEERNSGESESDE